MVLIGAVIPFLMVLNLVTTTFFLAFFTVAMSTAGSFLGIIGAVTWYNMKNP
jgi:hypothetical protein